MNGTEILALPMEPNDSGADTIAGYLRELLHQLFREGEGFSGKRPFGNSGWEHDLQCALVKGGAVEGTLDPEGFIDTIDDFAFDDCIAEAIDALR